MNVLGIIPARFASSRLEGKPLKDICGKTMIQRVYEQATQALEHVYIATDDARIEAEVKRFGGNVVMTSTNTLPEQIDVSKHITYFKRN